MSEPLLPTPARARELYKIAHKYLMKMPDELAPTSKEFRVMDIYNVLAFMLHLTVGFMAN